MSDLAIVSVSGGKDSTATALLAIDRMGRENCRIVFADTGNEHELTYEYVNGYLGQALGLQIETVKADFAHDIARKRAYVLEKWPGKGVPDEIVQRALSVLHPTGVPFLDLILWKGRFPSRKAQFCTQELKRYPLDAYLMERMREGFKVESWRGIRRDESQNRKDAIDREHMPEGYDIVHPIVAWTAQQVVDFVTGRGFRLNPLYSLGMGRVGCMPCINCSKDELAEISKRFPEHIDKIREWEFLTCLAAKRGWTTFFADAALRSPRPILGWIETTEIDDTTGLPVTFWLEPDALIHARLNIDARVEWALTSHGGRQQDFIRAAEPKACASLYGLCE